MDDDPKTQLMCEWLREVGQNRDLCRGWPNEHIVGHQSVQTLEQMLLGRVE